MCFSRAGAADKDVVALLLNELTGVERADLLFIGYFILKIQIYIRQLRKVTD